MSFSAADRKFGTITLDIERIRADFPLLQLRREGKPFVYLDNSATTQKPQCVIDKVCTYYKLQNANVHRAVYRLGQSATDEYEEARSKVQRFLGARTPAEIVFTRGTTDGINLVANSFGRTFIGEGDEVLISAMEHHSNIVPWQMLCRERGAVLRVAPIDEDGSLLLEEFQKLLNEKTKLVSILHVSNALGTINPIRRVIDLAHDARATVLIDGAQSGGRVPIDVAALGCDFFVCSGHKMFGPTGTGVLYGKEELLDAMPPYQGGGDMVQSVSFRKATYKAPPYKFEAGTPNIAGVIGLGAAIDYLNAVGMANVAAYEQELLAYGTQLLESIEGIRLIGTAKEKAAIWSFRLDDTHPHDIAQILDSEGVAVRAGHHCAQPVLRRFGVAATVRASLAFYNTREELDALSDALRKAKEVSSGRRAFHSQVILDHNKNPRNFHAMDGAAFKAEGHNPLCGDQLTVYLRIEGDTIADASFTGSGCAIARSSASVMTTVLKGKTVEEAKALSARFQNLVSADPEDPVDSKELGKLAAFCAVREYPVRMKCATLAWHTMLAALPEKPATEVTRE